MRGNLGGQHHAFADQGPIPAYAGEPTGPLIRPSTPRAYPRVCGGTLLQGGRLHGLQGLSPRMRGNRSEAFSFLSSMGPIPAYAGEPPQMKTGDSALGAYPRVCGGTDHSD